MKQKKKGSKAYLILAIAIILGIVLANPGWLPLSDELKQAIAETERSNLILRSETGATVAQLVTLLLSVCIVVVCYYVLKGLLRLLGKSGKRTETVTNLLTGLLRYIAVIVGLIWGLSILGVNTSAVVAGVGIIGLIVGFGAQSLIEDIITGAFIIFENQYSVGDIIVLDEVRGTVRSIGVRTTVIEDAGGNLKVVNNSDIRNFQNRSRITSIAVCICSVAYGTDLRALEDAMAQRLPGTREHHPDLYLSDIKYMGVENLGESGVDLKFNVDTSEENFFPAQRMLARDVKLLLDDLKVEIPFPQVVVHKGD